MRVIVIDPKKRTITEQQVEQHHQAFQKIVGGMVERLRFSECWCGVNETERNPETHAWRWIDPKRGRTRPLNGRAFLCNNSGDREADCTLTLETVKERVKWEQ